MPATSTLDPQLINALSRYRQQIEAQRKLPQEVLDIIYANRWFQLAVPQACAGLEKSLPEIVAIFDALAAVDANIAWCVNLGAGANMFSGYLAPEIASSIFSSPQTAIAGSGKISGTAQPTAGGWMVTGQWKYASGADHATHFTANATLCDASGSELKNPDGTPQFLSFLFPASDVDNLGNWDAIGLRGTSSHDFAVKNAFVPHAHTFSLTKPSPFANSALYRFPFESMAIVNMTSMQTGIARHFLEQFRLLAQTKKPYTSQATLAENSAVQQCLQNHEQAFTQARKAMFDSLQLAWDQVESKQTLAPTQQKTLHDHCRKAAATGLAMIDALYPLCGMNILQSDSTLNQIWRDAHTASQHFLLSPLNN